MRRVRRVLLACLLAFAGTGCQCVDVIDGNASADQPGSVGRWLADQLQPVDFQSSGFWFDGAGAAIGWSSSEDSDVCVFDLSAGR